MGYTHHFKVVKDIGDKLPKKLIEDVRRILDPYIDAGVIQYEQDNSKRPVIETDGIRFNGVGENAHETFTLLPDSDPEPLSTFCKTARKSYDLPVCLTLLLAKYHLGNKFELSSDGFSSTTVKEADGCWVKAISMLNELGFDIGYMIRPRKKLEGKGLRFADLQLVVKGRVVKRAS